MVAAQILALEDVDLIDFVSLRACVSLAHSLLAFKYVSIRHLLECVPMRTQLRLGNRASGHVRNRQIKLSHSMLHIYVLGGATSVLACCSTERLILLHLVVDTVEFGINLASHPWLIVA